jgi:hypothetical protein
MVWGLFHPPGGSLWLKWASPAEVGIFLRPCVALPVYLMSCMETSRELPSGLQENSFPRGLGPMGTAAMRKGASCGTSELLSKFSRGPPSRQSPAACRGDQLISTLFTCPSWLCSSVPFWFPWQSKYMIAPRVCFSEFKWRQCWG